MKMRSVLMIVLALLPLMTVLLVFAQGEPMANPECTSDFLSEDAALIDQYYANAEAAFQEGDVRTWLEQLQSVSVLTSGVRAFCDGYAFEGDAEGRGSQVFGPVTFEPGIYTVTATTDGPIIVTSEEIEGDCRLSVALNEGEASEGAQEIFRVEDEACTVLLEVTLIRENWRVEFTLVSAED